MLLITMVEWSGPQQHAEPSMRNAIQSGERLVAFATRLPLRDALVRIRRYQDAFKAHYTVRSVEFRLVAVSNIDDLSDQQLDAAQVELVEHLKQSAQDF